MPQRLPRNQKDLEALLKLEYEKGWFAGHTAGKIAGRAEVGKQFASEQQQARLDALKVVTNFVHEAGLAVGELSRAMASEHGQL